MMLAFPVRRSVESFLPNQLQVYAGTACAPFGQRTSANLYPTAGYCLHDDHGWSKPVTRMLPKYQIPHNSHDLVKHRNAVRECPTSRR
jgi:hypothetical protein